MAFGELGENPPWSTLVALASVSLAAWRHLPKGTLALSPPVFGAACQGHQHQLWLGVQAIQLPFLVGAWIWGLCWRVFPPASVNLAAFLPLASHGNELCSLTMHYVNNTRICTQGRVICL